MRFSIFLISLAALVFSACGKIPKPYRGNYEDSGNDVQLSLKRSEGRLTLNGKTISAKPKLLRYRQLEEGKAGIYLKESDRFAKAYEVFWLKPDMSTREEEQGLIWYESQLAYFLIDEKELLSLALGMEDHMANVSEIRIHYCAEGSVMLDERDELWQAGCPAEAEEFILQRMSR